MTDLVVYEVSGPVARCPMSTRLQVAHEHGRRRDGPSAQFETAGDLVLSQFVGYYPDAGPTGTPTPTADLNSPSTDACSPTS